MYAESTRETPRNRACDVDGITHAVVNYDAAYGGRTWCGLSISYNDRTYASPNSASRNLVSPRFDDAFDCLACIANGEPFGNDTGKR